MKEYDLIWKLSKNTKKTNIKQNPQTFHKNSAKNIATSIKSREIFKIAFLQQIPQNYPIPI